MDSEDTTKSETIDNDASQFKAAQRLFEYWFKSDYCQITGKKRKQNENDESDEKAENDNKDKCKQ